MVLLGFSVSPSMAPTYLPPSVTLYANMEETMQNFGKSVEPGRTHMKKREVDADRPLVLIVDDDERVRLAIQELVHSVGLDAACFGSTQELMKSPFYDRPGCLILDVRLPGLSGLDFQQYLNSSGKTKPIVFLTGHAD